MSWESVHKLILKDVTDNSWGLCTDKILRHGTTPPRCRVAAYNSSDHGPATGCSMPVKTLAECEEAAKQASAIDYACALASVACGLLRDTRTLICLGVSCFALCIDIIMVFLSFCFLTWRSWAFRTRPWCSRKVLHRDPGRRRDASTGCFPHPLVANVK